MGSYAQDEDLDEYEDDFIDDQDGDGDVGARKYADEEFEDEEDEYEEEEVEVERVSEDTLKILKYRQKIKEELRRKENGGGLRKSLDQGRNPPMNNFGSFFGPSRPVIADRVFQESKALLETRHLAPKASTSQSQSNGKKVSMPSISGPKNVVSRPPHASQVKSKVQIIKQTRDYSFLLSDDADAPKPHKDPGQLKNSALKHDARPAQVPSQSNRPSGNSDRKVVNGYEQRKQHGPSQVCSTRTAPVQKLTSDNRASITSSDSRRQLDLREPPQPTKKLGANSGSGSIRPPAARALPSKPSSSNDRRMPASSNDRRMPASSNDQRMPSSSSDRRLPASSNDRRLPSSSNDRRLPSSSNDRRMPSSSNDRRMPSSSNDRKMPSSSNDRKMPSSSNDRKMPSSSNDRRMPSSSTDRRLPSSSTDRRMPSSSTDRRMPVGNKAPIASVSNRSLPNGQRLPVEKSKASGGIRPQDRNMSVQHSRDNRVLKKENMVASHMKPPKQSSVRADLDRDPARVRTPHGRANGQPAVVKKDLNSRKRNADDDEVNNISSIIGKMFGYNKYKYVDNDDEDDCMEADFRTVQEEERRSARIARQEDEEELAKIMEEERQEMLRRKAKRRKMSQS